MELSLATPDRIVFQGPVDDILLWSEKGQINILDRHTNFISYVRQGSFVIKAGAEKKTFEVGDGVIRVLGPKVTVLVQSLNDTGN